MATRDVQTVTALPDSPLVDRRKRMLKYTLAMSIRTACLIGLVIAPGWWRFVFAAGAIVLPYIAVIVANVGASGASDPIQPGAQPLAAIAAPTPPAS